MVSKRTIFARRTFWSTSTWSTWARTIAAAAIATIYCLGFLAGWSQAAADTSDPVTLIDENGRTVTTRDFTGRPSLVFFGFTNCPSVCPTTLAEISERLRDLGPLADRLNVIFISADPERDTPGIMREYTDYFDKRIVGLTGKRENVARLARSLGAVIRKVPLDEGGYTVDHSSMAFLMDRDWQRKGLFLLGQGIAPERANAKLREFIAGVKAEQTR